MKVPVISKLGLSASRQFRLRTFRGKGVDQRARIDRSVLREFIIERQSPVLAARWGHAERVGGVTYRAQGGRE